MFADIAQIEKGETVLVHSAAGGVDSTAIQMAKILRASLVIGTVGSEEKKKIAYEVGADHVLTYEDSPKCVNELTNIRVSIP